MAVDPVLKITKNFSRGGTATFAIDAGRSPGVRGVRLATGFRRSERPICTTVQPNGPVSLGDSQCSLPYIGSALVLDLDFLDLAFLFLAPPPPPCDLTRMWKARICYILELS